jgi:hypothetical protein
MKGADTYIQEEQQDNLDIHVYEAGEIVTVDLKRDWEKVSVNEQVSWKKKLESILTDILVVGQKARSNDCAKPNHEEFRCICVGTYSWITKLL